MAGQGPKNSLSVSDVQALVDKQPNWSRSERNTLEDMMHGYFAEQIGFGKRVNLRHDLNDTEQSILNHLPGMHGAYQDHQFLTNFTKTQPHQMTGQEIGRMEQLFQRYHPETYGEDRALVDGKYSATEQGHMTRLMGEIVGEMKNTIAAVKMNQPPLKPRSLIGEQPVLKAQQTQNNQAPERTAQDYTKMFMEQRRARISESQQPQPREPESVSTNITTQEAMAFPNVHPQGVDVSFVELTYDGLINRNGANDGDPALFKFEETGRSYLVSKNDAGQMEFRDVTGKNVTDVSLRLSSNPMSVSAQDITHVTAPIIPVTVEALAPSTEKQSSSIQKPEVEQVPSTEGILGRTGEIDNAHDYLRNLPADDVARMQEKLGVDNDSKWGEQTMAAASQYISNNDLPQNITFDQLRDEMGIGYNVERATHYSKIAAALPADERPKQEFTEKGGEPYKSPEQIAENTIVADNNLVSKNDLPTYG